MALPTRAECTGARADCLQSLHSVICGINELLEELRYEELDLHQQIDISP